MKRRLMILAGFLLLLGLAACGGQDLPPTDGSPEPPVLSGVFVSEYGTLTFNGDGHSVTLDLSDELSEAAGLPAGRQEGSYVFLFHNGEWRRDKAETFRIRIGDEQYPFRNALGLTDADTVAAYLIDGAEAVAFEKQ